MFDGEIVDIFDKLLDYRCIILNQHETFSLIFKRLKTFSFAQILYCS